MLLVGHAVVVSMDPAGRIFLDGSVQIDGERIEQVGRAADVRAPQTSGRRRRPGARSTGTAIS